jgi:hypothetical protein
MFRVALFSFFFNFIFSNLIDLGKYKFEKNLYSQFKEEGIILKIFEIIGTTNKFCIEFGAGDGISLSNTAYLREKYDWDCLLLEGTNENQSINLYKEFLTKDNVCPIFEKYCVPIEFDFLSIDIDGNDFYIFDSILRKYSPRLILVETNPNFNTEEKVMPYNEQHIFENNSHYGASLFSFCKLAKIHNYTFVYLNAINAYFIRDDILNLYPNIFMHSNKPEFLAERIYCWPDSRNKKMIYYDEAIRFLGY